MPGKVVSIINLKGGVGKSTLTMMLGEYLAFVHEKNVLLVDMDAQANLSYCMVPETDIQEQERIGRTTYHLLRDALRGKPRSVKNYITIPPLRVSNVARGYLKNGNTRIDMIVSTPGVAQLDQDVMDMWEAGQKFPAGLGETLLEALRPVLNDYDYVLIDCPPGLSVFSSTALIASDFFVSPVIPEPLSLQGVNLVQRRAAELNNARRSKVQFKGTILNIVKHYRKTHQRIAERLYGEESGVFNPFRYWVPDNERLRTLGDFNPELGGQWALGAAQKFSTVFQKYSVSYPLTNPGGGSLSRKADEGEKYRLDARIKLLVDEFQGRCK